MSSLVPLQINGFIYRHGHCICRIVVSAGSSGNGGTGFFRNLLGRVEPRPDRRAKSVQVRPWAGMVRPGSAVGRNGPAWSGLGSA